MPRQRHPVRCDTNAARRRINWTGLIIISKLKSGCVTSYYICKEMIDDVLFIVMVSFYAMDTESPPRALKDKTQVRLAENYFDRYRATGKQVEARR